MKNFGKIKNAIENSLTNSFLKESKDIKVGDEMKDIKKNPILRKEYLVYSNIEEANIPDRAEAIEFIKENLGLLEEYHPQSILNENIKLTKKLNDNIGGKISECIEYDNGDEVKKLHENLTKLIHLKGGKTKTLKERVDLMGKVADYIQNNQKHPLNESNEAVQDKELSGDLFIKFATEKFNKKYGNLNETEKKVIKSVLNNNEEEKKNIFEETKKDCVEEINQHLEEHSDSLETKDKLLKAKEKLLSMEYSKENFSKDINKMLSFKG